MRQLSPRRASVTKFTSYPTADKMRTPGEVATEAQTNNRKIENEMTSKNSNLKSILRKSLTTMDKQRKMLEKSMMAYSAKMKEISNSRTNELFREIHTRNSTRRENEGAATSICDSASVSSASTSAYSLPSNLHKARRHSEIRILKGFSQVHVPSPVHETRETPERLMSRLSLSAREKRVIKRSPVSNGSMSVCGEDSDSLLRKQSSHSKPLTSKAHFPWSKEAKELSDTGSESQSSDSAYSSEADDSELIDLASSDGDLDEQDSKYDSDFPLTSPRLHIRKHKKRHGRINNLYKQILLKQSKHLPKTISAV